MPNQKISNETTLTGSNLDPINDVLPIVDVSAGATGNRKITPAELQAGSPASTSAPGSMSASDKSKLDSINVSNLVTTNTTQTITSTKTISAQSLAVNSSKPSAPSAGNVLLYSRDVSGRPFVHKQTPDGREYLAQTGLARNSVAIVNPVDTTTTTYGQGVTKVGTGSITSPTDDLIPFMGNLASSSITNTFVTPNTTNIFCNISTNNALHCRGTNNNGFGGFFFFTRLYLPDASYPSTKIFVGMYSKSPSTDNKGQWDGYITSTDNPDGNFAAFQYSTSRGDSTWQFTTKDGTTQNVSSITGATFTVQKLYDFYIYCPRAGSTINYRLDNLTDGVTYEGSTSTNLPSANIYMTPGFQLRATAVNGSNLRWAKLYCE